MVLPFAIDPDIFPRNPFLFEAGLLQQPDRGFIMGHHACFNPMEAQFLKCETDGICNRFCHIPSAIMGPIQIIADPAALEITPGNFREAYNADQLLR